MKTIYNSHEMLKTTGNTAISFNTENGSIISLRHEKWGYELISDQNQAECWRILLPQDNFPGHYIHSKNQKLSAVENGKNYIKLSWENVTGEGGKKFPISVVMFARSQDDSLQLWLEIENNTDYPLAEIHYPVLNGISGLGSQDDSETIYIKYWGEPHNQFKGVGGAPSFNLGYPKSLAAIPYPCTLLGTFTAHDGLATP